MQLKHKANVVAPDGSRIGRLARVVLEPESGEVLGIVVRKGLGRSEEKVVAVSLIQAADSDELVHAKLTDKGPWDFNDTFPMPDLKQLQAAEREGRPAFGEQGPPTVEQVVYTVRKLKQRSMPVELKLLDEPGHYNTGDYIEALRLAQGWLLQRWQESTPSKDG